MDLYVYIDFVPIARILVEPHLESGTYVASMDI
jgi:hypothetical protein